MRRTDSNHHAVARQQTGVASLAYLCAFDELVDDVCPLHHGQLTQDVAHHPDGDAVEEMDALLNVGRVLRWLGGMRIERELPQL